MAKCRFENEYYLLSGLEGVSSSVGSTQLGFRFLVVHFVRAKSNFLYERHRHKTAEMIIPLRGVYKCLLNGKELSLKRGQALVIQPGDVHQDIFLPGMEYCGTIFDLDASTSAAYQRFFKAGIQPRSQTAPFKSLPELRKLRKLFARQETVFTHLVAASAMQAAVWETFASLPRRIFAPGFLSQSERNAFRQRLLRHFEARASARFDLDAMASAMDLSRSGLSHKCQRVLGMPPAKAFLDFRLRKAKEMLQASSSSVKEVCAALGFASQFHFSRAFKRRFGTPPSKL